MFLVTSNPDRQLLQVRYIGDVCPDELACGRTDVQSLLATLKPGFQLLVDLSQLQSIHEDCLPEIGSLMELFDRAGVESVVRIIPDESKDIGFNILTAFHYSRRPVVITCRNMAEAGPVLGLQRQRN